jgi:hypothetical protein
MPGARGQVGRESQACAAGERAAAPGARGMGTYASRRNQTFMLSMAPAIWVLLRKVPAKV